MEELQFHEDYNFFSNGHESDKFFHQDQIIRFWFESRINLYEATDDKDKKSQLEALRNQINTFSRDWFEKSENRKNLQLMIIELESKFRD